MPPPFFIIITMVFTIAMFHTCSLQIEDNEFEKTDEAHDYNSNSDDQIHQDHNTTVFKDSEHDNTNSSSTEKAVRFNRFFKSIF